MLELLFVIIHFLFFVVYVMDFKEILRQYDMFFGENVDLDDLSEEEIEEIIVAQENLGKALDSLILVFQINKQRKKKYEKRENALKKLISWCMRRMEVESYETEDGKVRTQFYYSFDTDMQKLPDEYVMASNAKIQGALRRWESVPGVIATDKRPTRIVR